MNIYQLQTYDIPDQIGPYQIFFKHKINNQTVICFAKTQTNKYLALKCFYQEHDIHLSEFEIQMELSKYKSEYIMSLYDSIFYPGIVNFRVAVMPRAIGGDLIQYFYDRKDQNFEIYKCVMKQCALAVEFLHVLCQPSLVHGDLKPENFMIMNHVKKSDNLTLPIVKLGDFGHSFYQYPGVKRRGSIGTPEFAPHEVRHEQPFDMSIDIWALGVTFYWFFANQSPFLQRNRDGEVVYECFEPQTVLFREPVWELVEPRIIILIRRMLQVNPDDRPSIIEILEDDVLKEVQLDNKQYDIKIEYASEIASIKTNTKMLLDAETNSEAKMYQDL